MLPPPSVYRDSPASYRYQRPHILLDKCSNVSIIYITYIILMINPAKCLAGGGYATVLLDYYNCDTV